MFSRSIAIANYSKFLGWVSDIGSDCEPDDRPLQIASILAQSNMFGSRHQAKPLCRKSFSAIHLWSAQNVWNCFPTLIFFSCFFSQMQSKAPREEEDLFSLPSTYKHIPGKKGSTLQKGKALPIVPKHSGHNSKVIFLCICICYEMQKFLSEINCQGAVL